jgi:response regulator RpfG family c-di-GMP phosphodiesterase
MTEKTKSTNYTDEQELAIREGYENGLLADNCTDESLAKIVDNLAAEFGKKPASVRQKLVRMGIYKAKTYKAKTGGKVERKADIVADIASALCVSDEKIESLENATVAALKAVRDGFTIRALVVDPSESSD